MNASHRVWGKLLLLAAALMGLYFGRDMIDRAVNRPSLNEQLIVAAAANDQPAFDEALADGASARGRDPQGTTALMLAACTGNVQRSQRLLELGAEVDAADQWGRTALMYAARCNQLEVMRLLLSRGADAAHRNTLGQTAREEAIAFGAHDAAAMLRARVVSNSPATDPASKGYDSGCDTWSPLV
jgi:ankyrin repeat protein